MLEPINGHFCRGGVKTWLSQVFVMSRHQLVFDCLKRCSITMYCIWRLIKAPFTSVLCRCRFHTLDLINLTLMSNARRGCNMCTATYSNHHQKLHKAVTGRSRSLIQTTSRALPVGPRGSAAIAGLSMPHRPGMKTRARAYACTALQAADHSNRAGTLHAS